MWYFIKGTRNKSNIDYNRANENKWTANEFSIWPKLL